ncbi:aldo/keto reductase [soil metagenome]
MQKGQAEVKKRKIGSTQLEVAPLAFGGNVFGWTIDQPTSYELLDAFVDAGLNLVDTADVYSAWKEGNVGGESETIIGNWFKRSGKRNKVVLATKCGFDGSTDKKNLSAAHIHKAVDASLKRLQTDHIDLYQAHVDDDKVPLDESLEAFDQLIKSGKVGAIGASNYSAARLKESLKVSDQHSFARFQCLQPEYNLYERSGYENGLEELCLKENIAVISYFSLARGFLSGKYRSEEDLAQSARGAGVKAYLNERGFRILDALDKLAKEYSSTPARIALAWLIARPSITAPIASATNLTQLEDLIASTKIILSPAAIEMLNEVSKELAPADK